MSIIITQMGKGAIKLDKSSFEEEGKLQKFILENPDSIPLYDIKEDIRLLILCPEFPTNNLKIDLLATDQDGEIYVIETKLYKNPDKRSVVAQVLDYGTSLWRDSYDFDTFVDKANTIIQKKFKNSFKDRLGEFLELGDDDVHEVIRKMKINLREGNIKFVVLMDELHEQLKNIIVFLNVNSDFTIYPVQLEHYNHKDMQITIPKIYCSENKRDSRTSVVPTDDEFIEAYSSDPVARSNVKSILDFVSKVNTPGRNITDFEAYKREKYVIFNIRPGGIKKIYAELPLDPQKKVIRIWANTEDAEALKEITVATLPGVELENKKLKRTGGIIARWPLQHYTLKAFEDFIESVKDAYRN